jgi:hypothetical protein
MSRVISCPTAGKPRSTRNLKAAPWDTASVMKKSPPKKAMMVQSSSANTRSGLIRRVVRRSAAAPMAAAATGALARNAASITPTAARLL